jgi:hypothetical protein
VECKTSVRLRHPLDPGTSHLRRLAVLLVPVALGLFSAALPGRAQDARDARYAFADTTLLRDTLGLRFDRLFPLADSLQVTADTLRALAVRYHWSLERIVQLADSLGVPVDSVGPVLERERFNPLAQAGGESRRDFAYNTTYTVGQTQSAWHNGANYGFTAGPVFIRNNTTIQMDRYRAGGRTSLRQSRNSATELGWKFSPDLSLGGRAVVDRFDSRDPGSTINIADTRNEYQMSLRSRQRPIPGMTSEFNMFTGMLDLKSQAAEKRGLAGNANTRIRHQAGRWLTQELSGTVDGNLSRTRAPGTLAQQNTRDHSENLRATWSLFQQAPVSLKANGTLRHVQVESPTDSTSIRRILTDQLGGDVTVRLRLDNDRFVDLSERISNTRRATVLGENQFDTRGEDGFNADGRYLLHGFNVEGHFRNGFTRQLFPTRTDSGGYGELQHSRSLDGSVSRPLTSQINLRLAASLSLTSFRYHLIGRYPTPPVSRDLWRQSWRASANYGGGQRLSSSVALEVSKNNLINIPSASVATNNDVRSYRGEWSWSYRLLPGLTANQRNTITADYTEYPFSTDNNRLALDYGALTELSAVLTTRWSVKMSHNAKQSPNGNYRLYPDGFHYFSRADENETYTLRADVNYSPSPAISLLVSPSYFASDRLGTVSGSELPQRRSRTLDFSGGASINWKVGAKGTLRGDIRRTYRADRATTYSQGVEQPSPLSEVDYWNGSMQFSWTL